MEVGQPQGHRFRAPQETPFDHGEEVHELAGAHPLPVEGVPHRLQERRVGGVLFGERVRRAVERLREAARVPIRRPLLDLLLDLALLPLRLLHRRLQLAAHAQITVQIGGGQVELRQIAAAGPGMALVEALDLGAQLIDPPRRGPPARASG